MTDRGKSAGRKTEPGTPKPAKTVEKRGGYSGSPVRGPVPTPQSPGATVNRPAKPTGDETTQSGSDSSDKGSAD